MAGDFRALATAEQEWRDRFADFERGVLQDNITLCDGKSGVLLAFDGAMVIFCVEAFVELQRRVSPSNLLRESLALLFVAAGLAFLISCHFALTTVVPRLRRGKADHIFWEAPVFGLSEDRYVETMERLDVSVAWSDKLRHLHMLAGICKKKFSHFQVAIRVGQVGFVLLVAAEFGRMVV